MLEILAPAGNIDCAKAAIHNGANAIYLGYSAFSARQSAENFNEESLKDVIIEAHLHNVKVYVAMNTIVKDSEVEVFLQTLLLVWGMGADAIIMQDALLGKRIHALYPDIVLHLSTQAGVCDINGAKFAKECGFSRVILARETPISEIERIAGYIETEVFVQGALCTCFSGQCYFSSFVGGNSGNRGRCKQPCRKLYSIDRSGFEEKKYAISLSDLCVGEDIEKLVRIGVVSFKIEGRMRRAEYVAAAVRYYKSLVDNNENNQQALSDLKRTYNRGNYTKGLAFGQDKRFLSQNVQGHLGEKVGVVKVISGKFFVESQQIPSKNDAFKILRNGIEVGGAYFEKAERRGFYIQSKTRLKNGDTVFITTDTKVNEKLLQAQKKAKLTISLHFKEGERAFAECSNLNVKVFSDEVLQTAEKQPLTKDEIKACFKKTDGLLIDVLFEKIVLQGNIFLPKSKLNAFRREFFKQVLDVLMRNGNTMYEFNNEFIKTETLEKIANTKIAVISTDFKNVHADIAIFKGTDYTKSLPDSFKNGEFEKYVYYPVFCTKADKQAILSWIKETEVKGVYVENYGGIVFARENNLKVFAGTGLHLINRLSLDRLLNSFEVEYYAISKEANYSEAEKLISEKSFVLSLGDIKIMDLLYCPFGKTCSSCDKKNVYKLKDENEREFPMLRYNDAMGNCRFEVYNCANLIGSGVKDAGKLLDLSITQSKEKAMENICKEEKQKEVYKSYTSGHLKRGIL